MKLVGMPVFQAGIFLYVVEMGLLNPGRGFRDYWGLPLDPALLTAQMNVSFVKREVPCPGNGYKSEALPRWGLTAVV